MVYVVMTSFDPASAAVVYLYIALMMPLFDVFRNVYTLFSDKKTVNNSLKVAAKIMSVVFPAFPALIFKVTGFVFLLLYVKEQSIPIIVIACLLSGCRYYENFVPKFKFISDMKKDGLTNRNLFDFVSSIVKILTSFISLTIIFAVKESGSISALFGANTSSTGSELYIDSFIIGNDPTCGDFIPYVIALVNILSTLLFYKTFKAACDIRIETLGFGIPLTTVLPILNVLVIIPVLELKSKPRSLSFGQCDATFVNWTIERMTDIAPVWWKLALSLFFAVVGHIFHCFHTIKPIRTKRVKTRR